MTRILHLAKYYPPTKGGMETHISTLCEELASKGHDVACYAFGAVKKDTKGVRVETFKSWFTTPPFSPRLLWKILLNRKSFDVIHVHSPNPWAELCALIAKPKRLVVSYHSDIIGKRGAWLYLPFQKMLLRRANAIIAASLKYAQTSNQLKHFASKTHIIPYGIPRMKKPDAKLAKNIRARLKGPIFLFVGRLVEYKGLKYLIEAMKNVEGTLIIAGHGPLKENLASLSQSLGLQERVIFKHNLSDDELPNYYAACDVFVLPSITRAEGFGLVQLEAMQHAKPSISTKLGTGTDEVNVDGKTGIVVRPADQKALLEAMNTLGKNTRMREQLGRGAKDNFAKYNYKKMASAVSEIYSRI